MCVCVCVCVFQKQLALAVSYFSHLQHPAVPSDDGHCVFIIYKRNGFIMLGEFGLIT